MNNTNKLKVVYGCVILTAFLFSTMEVALKLGGSNFSALQLTFLRFAIGGIIMIPFVFAEVKKTGYRPSLGDGIYMLGLGLIGIAFSMVFFQMGVVKSNAATAAVLISVNPLFTTIFARILLKENISRMKIISIIISLVGVVVIIAPWTHRQGDTFEGTALTLLAAVLFGLYTALGKKRIGKIGTIPQTCGSFLLGSLALLVLLLVKGEPVLTGVSDHFLLVMYLGVFVTGLAYLSYFTAIKLSDATTGSVAFFLKPAFAPFMAIIFLHEAIPYTTWIGIAVILVGSYISFKDSKMKHGQVVKS